MSICHFAHEDANILLALKAFAGQKNTKYDVSWYVLTVTALKITKNHQA